MKAVCTHLCARLASPSLVLLAWPMCVSITLLAQYSVVKFCFLTEKMFVRTLGRQGHMSSEGPIYSTSFTYSDQLVNETNPIILIESRGGFWPCL